MIIKRLHILLLLKVICEFWLHLLYASIQSVYCIYITLLKSTALWHRVDARFLHIYYWHIVLVCYAVMHIGLLVFDVYRYTMVYIYLES